MENKQPKEIWIPNYISTQKVGQSRASIAPYKIESTDLKYVSETYHNEIVEGLKAEIERLKSKAESKRKHWNTK